jgi:hypothetical protein
MIVEVGGLSFSLDGERVLVSTGRPDSQGIGHAVDLISLRSARRVTLAESRSSDDTESALLGDQAVLLFARDSDDSSCVFFDLGGDTLPVGSALNPPTTLYASDSLSPCYLTVSEDGSIAWTITDDMPDGTESAVFVASPGEGLRCMSAAGDGPVFSGRTLFWTVTDQQADALVAGADLDSLESFTVAGTDDIEAAMPGIVGSGGTLVVQLRTKVGAPCTLRVFDVD